MRYALCNELFSDWSLPRACAFMAETGYAGVELAPFTFAPDGVDRLSAADLRAVSETIRAAGLEVVGLHWLLVGPDRLHLTSADAEVRRRTSRYLCALVDCCAALGGRTLVLGSPKQRNLDPDTPAAVGWTRAVEALAPAVEQAARRGVRWALEPLPAVDTNFLNSLADCLHLDGLLGGGPALGVQLDVKSLCAEADDPAAPAPALARYAASAERFVHFHANDRNLGAPGSGDVDFRPVFATLAACGYDAWVSVEVFDTRAGAEAIARDSLAYLRRAAAGARSGLAGGQASVDGQAGPEDK